MSPCDGRNPLPGFLPLAAMPFEANQAVILGLDRLGVSMLGIYMRTYSCSDLNPQIMGDLNVHQVRVEVAYGGGKINDSNSNNGRLAITGCFLCAPYCFKTLQILTHLIFITTLQGGCCDHPHFVQDTMKLRASLLAQR